MLQLGWIDIAVVHPNRDEQHGRGRRAVSSQLYVVVGHGRLTWFPFEFL